MGKSYSLREHETMTVEIDGRAYEAELGNLTFVLDAAEAARAMASIAEPGIGRDEMVARASAFAESAHGMCAAMFGEEAADELLGGEHRLDVLRIADVLSIMADVASSEESSAAVQAAASGIAG